jgi:hypothetical protein
MTVSSNRFKRKCAVLVLFLFGAFFVSTVTGEDPSSDYFSDHFDGAIDPKKWIVQENTDMSGYPAYGGVVRVADSQISLSSDGSGFPCVTTAVNPFPRSGNFSVEFDLTYTCISEWGNGLWISDGPRIKRTEEKPTNVIFGVWADNGDFDKVPIRAELFDVRIYFSKIYGWEPSAPTHFFRLDYSDGLYTVFVDSVEVTSVSSQVLPDTIGFGHPPTYFIPFSPEHVAGSNESWSSFKIDCIKVSSNEQNTNSNAAQISLSVNSEVMRISQIADMEGALTDQEGNPMCDETVILSYCVSGTSNWDPIASAITDSNGFYSASWIPSATGNFALKAEWLGNETYGGTYTVENVSISRYEIDNLFFVESNSTLTSLVFNSTSKEVGFTVSGPSGTTGYVKIRVSKTLMPDLNDYTVFIDGQQVSCTAESAVDYQSLYFTYSHSTHDVTIKLPTLSVPEFPAWTIPPTLIIASMSICLLSYFKKRKH